MFRLLLIALTALVAVACAFALPTLDIPRIDGLTIDGTADDWGARGYRVEALACRDQAADLASLDARLRLAWDLDGLLVLVTVHDNAVDPEPKDSIWKKDSVEIIVARAVGAPVHYQVAVGPSTAADGSGMRHRFYDRRPAGAQPWPELTADVASRPIAGGYVVEARMPWKNLGIVPTPGVLTAATVWVNDTDPGATARAQAIWFPCERGNSDTRYLHALRLADRPSAPAQVAASGRYERFRRTRIDLTAAAAYVGTTVALVDGKTTLGTATFAANGPGASASVSVPMPAVGATYGDIAVVHRRKAIGALALPDAKALREREVWRLGMRTRFVFDGETFPGIDFEQPNYAEDVIGEYALTTTFYDADYTVVRKAATPGRYGAVVDVVGKAGLTRRFYLTLFRTPEKVKWGEVDLKLAPELPAGLGIDPAVAREQAADFSDELKWRFADGMSMNDSTAALLAGLYGQKPAGAARRGIDGPWTANDRWWFGLRKQRGDIAHRYLTFLPQSYETQPERRFPLILFLHGSGERGTDLNQVRMHGPHKYLAQHPELPVIEIAPQCPPDRWWSPYEVLDLLDEVQAKYRVDPDRVYLTGLSMGGYGTWNTACLAPERFAAAVPICGGGNPVDAPRMKGLPTWAFHGDADTTVPITRSQEMVDALKAAGGAVQFTVYPGVGHDSWTQAYNTPELYTWLLAQTRHAQP